MTETNIEPGTVVETTWGPQYTIVGPSRASGYPATMGWLSIDTGGWLNVRSIARIVSTPAPQAQPAADNAVAFNRDLIYVAIDYKRPVNFTYRKANGEVTSREITPEAFVTTDAGNTLVIADDDDGEIRSYRLDRIVGYASV